MRKLSTFVLILSLAAMLAACGESEPRPRNLLLITLDTLRADRLGSYGYAAARTPNLDRLAGRGLRFERAATVVPLTLPAHASLMTGTHPGFHGVRDNGGFYLEDEAETLAEVLRANRLRTGAFVGAFVLDSRWGIGQGFDHFHDDFDLSEFQDAPGMDAIQRPGSEVVDRALAWLEAEPGEIWSFFTFDPAVKVGLEGVRWPLTDASIDLPGHPSISNEAVGDRVTIGADGGAVVVVRCFRVGPREGA